MEGNFSESVAKDLNSVVHDDPIHREKEPVVKKVVKTPLIDDLNLEEIYQVQSEYRDEKETFEEYWDYHIEQWEMCKSLIPIEYWR